MNPIVSSHKFNLQYKVTPEKMKQFLAEAGFLTCVFLGVGAYFIPCLKAERYAVDVGDQQLLEDGRLESIW